MPRRHTGRIETSFSSRQTIIVSFTNLSDGQGAVLEEEKKVVGYNGSGSETYGRKTYEKAAVGVEK